ncbi:hypothetical protein CHGG_00860 [Chaetomium globosum CBS 148.51]|uniref:Ras-GAP domain-containing protein n=1 Tax=Chaetomium globosum (strain ATCC 6205 / CBS 148.51 / DSM 1962 / NBRC 6347 / NRRL 1970) TaxID=306901 RepID=Q2HFZ4_CHAGB|nr:uncharacterized protein CHGG_00860 [Chaetomium globosum CBS 148.51]EAQ92625.1 hypothetical protein CHGG_00860 [Chaetomium globosum CBS 148.51]
MSSSYRPHPLRQAQTADYPVFRPSSSASSGYSNASSGTYELGRSSISSSPSSTYSNHGHKRGQSEVTRRPPPLHSSQSHPSTPMSENIYHAARQSLRPLPQVPRPTTPPRAPTRHDRGHSVDIGKLSIADHGATSPTSPTPPTPPHRSPNARPTSMLLTRADSPTARPTSMILTHSDTVRRGSDPPLPPALLHAHTAPLSTPDLERLGRSSTNQLRTLSRLAQSSSAEEFSITSPAQEVVGLKGRRRLQRADKAGNNRPAQRTGGYGWEGRNWMDKQRQFLQAYEYLCHIGEAKEWIEDVIQRAIPPIVELEEALRDGVTLAEVVESLNPQRRFKIFHHPRLQYRHSDNIAIFFRYLDEVELPDLFRFELIDLYEKKNIPKVIHCIHALSWLLYRKGIVGFRIGNLVGQLEFEHHELEAMQKGLDKLGTSMPSFGNMGADFGVVEEPPEPEETEEERIDRELAENEAAVADLQAQIRGAVLRMQLGDVMQNLWDSEDWLIDLQARIRGDFTRQIMDYRLQMKRFAVRLQSAARGFLVRQRQEGTEQVWKSVEGDIMKLQSLVRASKARSEVRDQRSELAVAAGPIRDIQATFRGFLLRKEMMAQEKEVKHTAAPVAGLQAAVRGLLLRQKLGVEQMELQSETGAITSLQAAARAALARGEIASQREALEDLAPMWETLQAASRGRLARRDVSGVKAELQQHSTALGLLQSHSRAAAVRREISEVLEGLGDAEDEILTLQSTIRGMLERNRVSDLLEALDQEEDSVTQLQSHIRGVLCRQQNNILLDDLEENDEEVAALQSLARAMLLRDNVARVLDELEENEEVVGEIQSAAKAFIVRAKFEEKKRHYNENMQKVVKIQSFVRAKLQGEAYKSLTSGKNPPVNAVKNFVHLLNDSDFDFNEEVEFERLRKTVVQQVRQNEMLEQYIDQLDIKIALLVKNKITLDEVVRHQSNFGGHASNLLANSSMASVNQFDLKALNKGSRKKLESYQQLFFALQTQPQYLARLFKRLREQGTAEKECKRVEHLMMGLFGYAQKRREEYYLLKLIGRSIREEVETCKTIQDYLRGNFFWSRLVHNYTRSPRDRKYLRDLLGPLIRDNIIEDPELDLESDPMQIYRFLCRQAFEALCQRFQREPQDRLLQIITNWLWKFYLQPAVTTPENVGVMDKQLSPLQKRNLGEVAKVLGQITSGKQFGGDNIYLQPLNAFVAEAIERLAELTQNLITVPDAESTFDIDEFNDLIALENILRLEQLGRISRHNHYQDVLNAIAVDIRTKSRRRVQRQRELEGVRLMIGNLHDKAKYLEQQRRSYDDYIEQAMATLQNKKGKKRFLLPFTKQYNHQRELERSGRVPKFGSYKYSVRALSDKGVVVSWQGIPERDWGQINLTISCDEVGVFTIEGSRGHIQMPGASALVPIEDLLQAQFEAHQFMNLFEGGLKLNVNLLLHLLYKKFYRTQ